MIEIKINHKKYKVQKGKTILEICRQNGIDVASLCSHPDLSKIQKNKKEKYFGEAVCRLCLVKVRKKGEKKYQLQPSCKLKAETGLEVISEDAEIIRLRRTNLELLFANHAGLCSHCSKNMDCELQDLAIKYDIDEFRFVPRLSEIESSEELEFLYEKMSRRLIDDKNPCIARDSEKCINCGRCVRVCEEIQKVGALSSTGKNNKAVPGTEYNVPLECSYCGQCTTLCPTGALTEKSEIGKFIKAVNDSSKTVIAQVAPSLAVSLGEEFEMVPGAVISSKLTVALKKIGVDLILDTGFGADLALVEESSELLEKIRGKKESLPLFSSFCPSWVLFLEQNYPEFLENLSTARSPFMALASLTKSYYARQNKLNPKSIFSVSITPCIAEKYEATKPEFKKKGFRDIDCVLTPRELGRIMRGKKLKITEVEDSDFNQPLGRGSKSGFVFENSGSVTEAVLKTACQLTSKKNQQEFKFVKTKVSPGIEDAELKCGFLKLKAKIVSGLGNARKVLESIKKGKSDFDFLEVMACPYGCIGGGGQPIPTDSKIKKARRKSLNAQSKQFSPDLPLENPAVAKIYNEFLISSGSRKAKRYLHTGYKQYHYKWRK
jgi:iron-only hydrogenase group A